MFALESRANQTLTKLFYLMIKIPEWLSGSKSGQINESNDWLELPESFTTHSACVIHLYYTTSLPLPSMIKHGSWHEFGHF